MTVTAMNLSEKKNIPSKINKKLNLIQDSPLEISDKSTLYA